MDENERTTAIGLYNYAQSYWKSAATLKRAKVPVTHPHAPMRFCYYHSIELYLKAFLRMKGVPPALLRSRKFGHDIDKLTEKATDQGLVFDDEDRDVFKLIHETDAAIRSRYIRTGMFQWPDEGALDRTCKSLNQSVGEALQLSGIHVRIDGIRGAKAGSKTRQRKRQRAPHPDVFET